MAGTGWLTCFEICAYLEKLFSRLQQVLRLFIQVHICRSWQYLFKFDLWLARCWCRPYNIDYPLSSNSTENNLSKSVGTLFTPRKELEGRSRRGIRPLSAASKNACDLSRFTRRGSEIVIPWFNIKDAGELQSLRGVNRTNLGNCHKQICMSPSPCLLILPDLNLKCYRPWPHRIPLTKLLGDGDNGIIWVLGPEWCPTARQVGVDFWKGVWAL